MRITRVDHISIAVRDLDKAMTTFSRLFNLNAKDRRKVKVLGMENVFIPLGYTAIELLTPLDEPDCPDNVRRVLDRRGEGIMNLALTVDDLEEAISHLRRCGVRVIDGKDADGDKIAFVHPKDVHGVLVELRTGKRQIKNR